MKEIEMTATTKTTKAKRTAALTSAPAPTALAAAMTDATKKDAPVVHRVTAMVDAGPFEFDLLDVVKGIANNYLAERVLSSIAYACDGRISSRIAAEVKRVRIEREATGEANWSTYTEFLNVVAGIATQELLMEQAGMEVKPLKDHMQQLLTLREAAWDIYEERFQLGSKTWTRPHVTDIMLNPRVRTDDAETLAKKKMLLDFEASDDDGVMNIDLRSDIEKAYALKDEASKREGLKWDKVRGALYAQFFNTLDLSDERTTEDPFGDLPAEDQLILMDRTITKYVPGALTRMVSDRTVTAAELGAATYEARGFSRDVKAALAHPKFKRVEV